MDCIATDITESIEMANNKDADPRADHELTNLLPEEADAVAGAVPPPTSPMSSGQQGPGSPPPNQTPGGPLEIETLEGAAAGTLTRTIRIKIENSDLNDPGPVD